MNIRCLSRSSCCLTELEAANVQAAPSRTTRVLASLNHRLQGYFPALGAFLLAMALHTLASLLFTPHVVGTLAFFLFVGVLTAAWCGYGPGLLVTILITCGMPYLFKPGFSIRTVDLGGVTVFLLLSVIVSGTASSRRRAEARLRSMIRSSTNELASRPECSEINWPNAKPCTPSSPASFQLPSGFNTSLRN